MLGGMAVSVKDLVFFMKVVTDLSELVFEPGLFIVAVFLIHVCLCSLFPLGRLGLSLLFETFFYWGHAATDWYSVE